MVDEEKQLEVDERMRKLLHEAATLTSKLRMREYGPPATNYGRIQCLWNAYLDAKGAGSKEDIPTVDAAVMMILTKVARLQQSPNHYDSWLDIAGYAAGGWALASEPDDDKKL